MASESSANAGSNVSSGNGASAPEPLADSRNEDREEGRSGVVGRDVRVREFDRCALLPWASVGVDILGSYGGV
jgi:hypothetical protein